MILDRVVVDAVTLWGPLAVLAGAATRAVRDGHAHALSATVGGLGGGGGDPQVFDHHLYRCRQCGRNYTQTSQARACEADHERAVERDPR